MMNEPLFQRRAPALRKYEHIVCITSLTFYRLVGVCRLEFRVVLRATSTSSICLMFRSPLIVGVCFDEVVCRARVFGIYSPESIARIHPTPYPKLLIRTLPIDPHCSGKHHLKSRYLNPDSLFPTTLLISLKSVNHQTCHAQLQLGLPRPTWSVEVDKEH